MAPSNRHSISRQPPGRWTRPLSVANIAPHPGRARSPVTSPCFGSHWAKSPDFPLAAEQTALWLEPVQGGGVARQNPAPRLDRLVPGEKAAGDEVREGRCQRVALAGRCDEVELGQAAGVRRVEQLAPGTQTQGLPEGAGAV